MLRVVPVNMVLLALLLASTGKLVVHASTSHSLGAPAQHAVPADRFAREIGPFFAGDSAARSRQLNGNPLDGPQCQIHS